MNAVRRIAAFPLAGLLLSGCTVGQDYNALEGGWEPDGRNRAFQNRREARATVATSPVPATQQQDGGAP